MKAHKAEISALKSQWTAHRVEACAQGTGGKILIQLEQMRGEQKKKKKLYEHLQWNVVSCLIMKHEINGLQSFKTERSNTSVHVLKQKSGLYSFSIIFPSIALELQGYFPNLPRGLQLWNVALPSSQAPIDGVFNWF